MADRVWHAAAYTRLSHEDGDKEESNSIGSQREMIREFIRSRTDMAIVHEYADDGYSGVNFERPGFRQMMADIEARTVDCIICKDLSRFARNYIDSGRYLEKIFPTMGVRFIAINDNYDSFGKPSQSDSLIIPFKNLINSYYSKDISRKVSSAVHARQLAAAHIPSMIPYGYIKSAVREYRFEPDPETAANVTRIFRMRVEGAAIIYGHL